jgi:TorA maturation chaperone TorD
MTETSELWTDSVEDAQLALAERQRMAAEAEELEAMYDELFHRSVEEDRHKWESDCSPMDWSDLPF